MIPKSGFRFSDKIMLKQINRAMPFRRGLLRRLQAARAFQQTAESLYLSAKAWLLAPCQSRR